MTSPPSASELRRLDTLRGLDLPDRASGTEQVEGRGAQDADLSRMRLEDFLAASGDWFWETQGLQVSWVSDSIERILGVPPSSYADHGLTDGLADDLPDLRETNLRARAAIEARQPFRDLAVRRPGPGGARLIFKNGVPVFDAQGAWVGYRGVSRDMTVAYAARRGAALAEAIEAISEPYVMTDPAGRILLTNARWRTINHVTAENLPKTWAELVRFQLDRGLIESALGREEEWFAERTARRGRRTEPVEVRCAGRDILLRDVILSDGSCVTAGQDVTAIRAEHRAAVEAARLLNLALTTAGLTIWQADLDQRTLSPVGDSPEFAEGLIKPTDLDAFLGMVDPQDRPRLEKGLAQVWAGQLDVLREELTVHGPGRVVRVAILVALQTETPDRSRRLLAVRQDVTALRRAEEDARLKTAAEMANRAKSDFLSRVGHELRTPLNAISGFAQVLADRPLADDETRRTLTGHVVSASRHLAVLLDDLLEMSQIDAGRLPIRAENVSICEVVGNCVRMIEPLAVAAGIALETAVVPAAWRVVADPTRLCQILLNLSSNAVKYNRPGGRVSIRVMRETLSDAVVFSVSDTGPGLSAEQIERIFEPFERLTPECGHAVEGLGLGLSIARGLALAMGGVISVQSVLGEGSTFSLRMPMGRVLPDSDHPVQPPSLWAGIASGPRRVLYVEDNRLNGLLMTQIFQGLAGLELRIVESGEEALDLLREWQPELLLLDRDLPGIDGLEVFRRIKAYPSLRALKVILVSADAGPDSVGRAMGEGFHDYWVKPLDVARVTAALRSGKGVASSGSGCTISSC